MDGDFLRLDAPTLWGYDERVAHVLPEYIVSRMSKARRNTLPPLDDTLFAVKQRKAVPHEFVLDAIAALSPETRPMFGCLAVYVGDKIVLILRDKPNQTQDNGVWLATTKEHHESLRRDFPNMRSIQVLGKRSRAGRSFRPMRRISRRLRYAPAISSSPEILESARYQPRDREPGKSGNPDEMWARASRSCCSGTGAAVWQQGTRIPTRSLSCIRRQR